MRLNISITYDVMCIMKDLFKFCTLCPNIYTNYNMCLFLCVSNLMLHRALLQADAVLLLGARLNWILHFGLPPRFDPRVKIIQVCERLQKKLV